MSRSLLREVSLLEGRKEELALESATGDEGGMRTSFGHEPFLDEANVTPTGDIQGLRDEAKTLRNQLQAATELASQRTMEADQHAGQIETLAKHCVFLEHMVEEENAAETVIENQAARVQATLQTAQREIQRLESEVEQGRYYHIWTHNPRFYS